MFENKFIVFFGVLILIYSTSILSRNVTNEVINFTDLDEKIRRACSDHCQGNRRAGYLRSVHVTPSGHGMYHVVVYADLVNEHNTGPILGIGGGAGWSYTVSISATGRLNSTNCNLVVEHLNVHNDQLGIGHLAKNEEGKTHKIENCNRFL